MNEIICSKCGTRQPSTAARFCPKCGTPFAAIPPPGNVQRWGNPVEPPRARRGRLGLMVGISALVLLGGVGLIAWRLGFWTPTPEPEAPQPVFVFKVEATATPGDEMPDVASSTPETATPTAESVVSVTATAATHTPFPTVAASATATVSLTATASPTVTITPTLVAQIIARSDGDRLNVRSGPGANYPIIAKVEDGGTAPALGRSADGQWVQVLAADNTRGWSSMGYVELNVAASQLPYVPPPTPLPLPAGAVFLADDYNMASGGCTTLRWKLDGIRAVYLDGNGVVGHSEQRVCPTADATYRLTIEKSDGSQVTWPLSIGVSGTLAGGGSINAGTAGATRAPVIAPTRGPVTTFTVDYQGCKSHNLQLGQVKGRVYDRAGNVIVGAQVEILIENLANIVPPSITNGAGWYEFNLTPKQHVRFSGVTVAGAKGFVSDPNLTVKATSGCYQLVDLRQQ